MLAAPGQLGMAAAGHRSGLTVVSVVMDDTRDPHLDMSREQKSDCVIIVALNAHAAAMIASAAIIVGLKEQDMPPSADALGLPDRQASAISQYEHELATLGLAAALGAAHVACAQLAARSRLRAGVEPMYQRNARAAFLHAAARFLHQACLVLDPGANMDDWRDPTASLIQLDTIQAVACVQPAITTDEQAVLAEAMSMLASEAAALATCASGPMAAVVTSVQSCIEAAASQLREAELFARSANADGNPA